MGYFSSHPHIPENRMAGTMRSHSERVEQAWQRLHKGWPNHQDVTTDEIMNKYNQYELYDEVSYVNSILQNWSEFTFLRAWIWALELV